MFKNILIIFCFIINTAAQDLDSHGGDSLSTKEILVETNRLKMSKSEAPNKLQIIDKTVLKNLNGSRLPDALNIMDGVFIKDYGFNSGIKTISLNSTQSEHTLILVDGIKLNSRQNAQYDLSLFDLNNIERIEISNGGLSALYGSEAIGGVINIITSHPSFKKFGFDLISSFGSFGYRNFYGKISQSFKIQGKNTISYDIFAGDERAENNFTYNFKTLSSNNEFRRENSDFKIQSAGLNLRYYYDQDQFVQIYTNYSNFNRGVPGPFSGYLTSTARQNDKTIISGISLQKNWNKNLNQKNDLSFRYQLQKYYDTATFGLNTVINSFYKTKRLSFSNNLTYSNGSKFSIDAGGEVNFDMLNSNETDEADAFQAAVYAVSKHIIKFAGSTLLIYPSARFDYYSNIREHNVATGKLGLNFQPFGKAELHFKSSFGNNFSAPTFNELYWKDIGNKELKPERSISFDAGIIYKFKLFAKGEVELSYYNIFTTDRIVWVPVSGSIWRPLNIQKVSSEGVSAGIKSVFELAKPFTVNFGFNYCYGSSTKKNEDFPGDPSYNKQLIYLPKTMVKASIMMNYLTTSKFLNFVSFNLFYNYSSKRYSNFENTVFISGYKIFDANIGFGLKINKLNAELRLIVNNLTNEQYSVISGYPMPGRNFKAEINFIY
ncbi:MAG: TonB-dependent receptor [Ignavibacteria bacterium]|nr:TonB-dependent receptor [Ignavibacteria bacterium]